MDVDDLDEGGIGSGCKSHRPNHYKFRCVIFLLQILFTAFNFTTLQTAQPFLLYLFKVKQMI